MKYHFKIKKEKNGYWASCIELDGCQTQANTLEELHTNMKEALDTYLDEPPTSSTEFPLPKESVKGHNVLEIECDVQIAFAMLVRQARLKYKLTQKKAAEKLGYKNIFTYQKLENAKTANPTLTTIKKIKEAFPRLNLKVVF